MRAGLEAAVTAMQAHLPHTSLHFMDVHQMVTQLYEDVTPLNFTINAPCLTTDLSSQDTSANGVILTECPSKGKNYFFFDAVRGAVQGRSTGLSNIMLS